MKTSIVVGLQYGDEGKGLITSFLSKRGDLVVRFNGGHQAGHTVVKNDHRHVFSSFGSGTLNNAHTYWSQYCTFYPKAFCSEEQSLIQNGIHPVFFIHPLAMVTTPFDVEHNRQSETNNNHGSVGVGFGATVARNELTPFKLYAIDLTYREILKHKLEQIADYYKTTNPIEKINAFFEYVDAIELNICTLDKIVNNYNHIIFEGAQGIMLDMDFGYFPNVTRSNTTSKNAIQIIKEYGLPNPNVHYVMRSYLTRHGNGFMPNENIELSFEDDTNVSHKYQGHFRQGFHSTEQLKYAVNCDSGYSGNDFSKKTLAITHLDQTGNKILADGAEHNINDFLNGFCFTFNKIIESRSPISEDIYHLISHQTPVLPGS